MSNPGILRFFDMAFSFGQEALKIPFHGLSTPEYGYGVGSNMFNLWFGERSELELDPILAADFLLVADFADYDDDDGDGDGVLDPNIESYLAAVAGLANNSHIGPYPNTTVQRVAVFRLDKEAVFEQDYNYFVRLSWLWKFNEGTTQEQQDAFEDLVGTCLQQLPPSVNASTLFLAHGPGLLYNSSHYNQSSFADYVLTADFLTDPDIKAFINDPAMAPLLNEPSPVLTDIVDLQEAGGFFAAATVLNNARIVPQPLCAMP